MNLSTLKKAAGASVIALGVAWGASEAHAVPEISLGLALDFSGSIDEDEFDLQKSAYANAIQSVIPTDGTVGISVTAFAEGALLIRPFAEIDSEVAKQDLVDFFNDLDADNRGIDTGSTAIGEGIEVAAASLQLSLGSVRTLIDVTTDGQNNLGVDPVTAAQDVVNAENITAVNALGIGTGTAPGFNFGTDSFSLVVADFAALEGALTEKLEREVNGIPEPATIALLAVGLAGVGFAARRRLTA